MPDLRLPIPPRAAALVLLALVAGGGSTGCSTLKQPVFEREAFGSTATFSRAFAASGERTCDAARRALLSQGYIVDGAKADLVQAHKNFQPATETHVQLSFSVVCVPEPSGGRATAFVNAVQDRYALKKTNNAATVGVSVLGSVSLPLPAGDDSMVKVASETVTSGDFYTRWFALLERFLAEGAPPAAVPPAELSPEAGAAAPVR